MGDRGHGVRSVSRFPDLHGDQHDVQELLVPPAVDDDVDGFNLNGLTCSEQRLVQATWPRFYELWHVQQGQGDRRYFPAVSRFLWTSIPSRQNVRDELPLRISEIKS